MTLETDDNTDDIAADILAAMNTPAEGAEAAPEAAQTKAEGPTRDEQGRFAAKEVDNPTEQVGIAAQPDGKAEPPPETIRPPSSWSAAAKARFASLDPEIQQEVLKRERDIETGKAQWDQKGERLNRFDGLFAPIKDRLTIAGIDEYAYTQALIRADEMLRNPATQGQALQMLAQQYGFNLPQAQPYQGQPQVQEPNPAFQSFQQQLQSIQQTLAQQAQQREDEGQQKVRSEVEAFSKDPKNLYFENVRADMANLAKVYPDDTLQQLYDKACWARDDIRPLIQQPKSDPKPKDGKPAGLQPTGAPGQTQPQKAKSDPASSIEDDVREAIKELQGVA